MMFPEVTMDSENQESWTPSPLALKPPMHPWGLPVSNSGADSHWEMARRLRRNFGQTAVQKFQLLVLFENLEHVNPACDANKDGMKDRFLELKQQINRVMETSGRWRTGVPFGME